MGRKEDRNQTARARARAREREREFNPAKSWHNKQLLPFRRNCAWRAARAETAFAGGISIKYTLHTINPFNPVTSGRTGNTVIVAMLPRGSPFPSKIFDSADNYARKSQVPEHRDKDAGERIRFVQ